LLWAHRLALREKNGVATVLAERPPRFNSPNDLCRLARRASPLRLGRHLGTIRVDERPANFAWGDADGRTPYMTAHTGLYRVRLAVSGTRPPLVARARRMP
jgi:hypothetical protein